MPPNPQIHNRYALPRIFHRPIPTLCDKPMDPILKLRAGQHSLCLVRPHHRGANSSTYHRARM